MPNLNNMPGHQLSRSLSTEHLALKKGTLKRAASSPELSSCMPSPIVFNGLDKSVETATYGGKAASVCFLSQNNIKTVPPICIDSKVFETLAKTIPEIKSFQEFLNQNLKKQTGPPNDPEFIKSTFSNLFTDESFRQEFRSHLETIHSKILESDLNQSSSSLHDEITSTIKTSYGKDISSKRFAVRSSGRGEDSPQHSFSGKFETKLFVPSEHIIHSIKEVFASAFTMESVNYVLTQVGTANVSDFNMGILIQEMVDSKSAGTAFIKQDGTIEINSVFGQGELHVSGEGSGDTWVLKPTKSTPFLNTTYTTYLEEIRPKSVQIVKNSNGTGIERKNIPDSERVRPSLDETARTKLLTELKKIKDAYVQHKRGSDVEWALSPDGEIFILQVRPITTSITEKNILRIDQGKVDSKNLLSNTGSPVSWGVVNGGVTVVAETPEEAEEKLNTYHPQPVILVVKNTTSAWEPVMRRAAGIIAQHGSMNSHTGIASREMGAGKTLGFPAIVNAPIKGKGHADSFSSEEVTIESYDRNQMAQKKTLKTGDIISLCGTSGIICRNAILDEHVVKGKIPTTYKEKETEESVPLEKHLSGARGANQTKNINGVDYIGKPITPSSQLLASLDKAAHESIGPILELSPLSENSLIIDHETLLMEFNICHQWRKDIREWDTEKHKQVLNLRKTAELKLKSAVENLNCNQPNSIKVFFDAYQSKVGLDNIAYSISCVQEGILDELAKKEGIKEPDKSNALTDTISRLGGFKQKEMFERFTAIQKKIPPQVKIMIETLGNLYKAEVLKWDEINMLEQDLMNTLTQCAFTDTKSLRQECEEVTTSYRIKSDDFAVKFNDEKFNKTSSPWLMYLVESNKLTSSMPEQPSQTVLKTYSPKTDYGNFLQICAESKKIHLDGHDTKVSALWALINKVIIPKAKIKEPRSNMLKIPFDDLLSYLQKDPYLPTTTLNHFDHQLNNSLVRAMDTYVGSITGRKDLPNLLDIMRNQENNHLLQDIAAKVGELIKEPSSSAFSTTIFNTDPETQSNIDLFSEAVEHWNYNKQFTKEDVDLINQIFDTFINESSKTLMLQVYLTHGTSLNATYTKELETTILGNSQHIKRLIRLIKTKILPILERYHHLSEGSLTNVSYTEIIKKVKELTLNYRPGCVATPPPPPERIDQYGHYSIGLPPEFTTDFDNFITELNDYNSNFQERIETRQVYETSSNSAIESFCHQTEESLKSKKHEGEYVSHYGQRQVAVNNQSIVTVFSPDDQPNQLSIPGESPLFGRQVNYSSGWKWAHPIYNTGDPEKLDRISAFCEYLKSEYKLKIEPETILNWKKSLSNILNPFESKSEFVKNLQSAAEIYTNPLSAPEKISISAILTELSDFFDEFDDGIDYQFLTSVDGSVPRLQPILDPTSGDRHRVFHAKYFEPLKIDISSISKTENPEELINKLPEDQQAKLKDAVIAMHHYYRYIHRPYIETSTARLAQNDAIYIPGQMLMVPSRQTFSKVVPSNRPVNLSRSWAMFQSILKEMKQEDVSKHNLILSNLAYNMASSCQSMIHTHIVPRKSKEGDFIVPVFDSPEFTDSFTPIELDPNSKLNALQITCEHLVSDEKAPLLRFSFDANTESATEQFSCIDDILLEWEFQTGCDLTWVSKLENGNAIIIVELRKGISHYTPQNIDDLNSKKVWQKIGFTELMGKKFSFLSQTDLDIAQALMNSTKPEHQEIVKKAQDLTLIEVQQNNGKKTYHNLFSDEKAFEKLIKYPILKLAYVLSIYSNTRLKEALTDVFKPDENQIARLLELIKSP